MLTKPFEESQSYLHPQEAFYIYLLDLYSRTCKYAECITMVNNLGFEQIKTMLKNNKDKTDNRSKSGVYEINWEECNISYIG